MSSSILSRCTCLRRAFAPSTAAPLALRPFSSTPSPRVWDFSSADGGQRTGGNGGGTGGPGGNRSRGPPRQGGQGGQGGQQRGGYGQGQGQGGPRPPRQAGQGGPRQGGSGGGPRGGNGGAPRTGQHQQPRRPKESPNPFGENWVPHDGSGAWRPRLNQSKLHAQERQAERVRSANLDKPKYDSPAGEKLADRLVRSAAALGLGMDDVGADLDEKRRRSRKFKTPEERAAEERAGMSLGAGAGAKRGTRGVKDRFVPGQVNYRKDRVEQGVGAGPAKPAPKPARAKLKTKTLRKVELPSALRLDNLLNILKLRLCTVQKAAERIGLTDVRPDRLLTSEDAQLLCMELGFDPIIDDEAAFDLYPAPPAVDPSSLPLRPPITGIFGHVDHGKTSLLDALRSTTVAAGEAGGITQHIGAFEVPVETMVANLRAKAAGKAAPSGAAAGTKKEGEATITFLDTPGHAAFTAMRSRGAGVTDVVVLVVAADDGVKPQTEEVIKLIQSAPDVGVVVALTKVDKPGIDTTKVKQGLMAAGVEVEDFGGDVPCVEVSSVTGQGMAELLETISAIAEVRELKAEREGRVEGRVIESRVEKGRGNVATILVLRGCLKPSSSLVAGTTWARVRTLTPPFGKAVTAVYPGQPIEVTGWKDLPSAGDLVLEAPSEDDAKRAVTNRLRRIEDDRLWSDVEIINEKQRRDAEILQVRREEEEKARAKGLKGNAVLHAGDAAVEALEGRTDEGVKELLLVIKADVSGTVEAVVGALQGIGNKEAKVKILSSAVGDVSQADVDVARAVGATIVGFNVKAPGSIIKDAAKGPTPVPIHTSPIIYRLVDTVRAATADLLPKNIETRVHGEATVQMVFEISVKGRKEPMRVAGSKVFNGVFQKARKARVVRNGETLFTGTVSTLKQVKKDVQEIGKGTECGIALDGFDDFQEGDTLQSVEEVAVARTL